MTKSTTVTIDSATINTKEFTQFLQRGLRTLDDAREATLDFKEIVKEAAEKTGLKPALISKYIKSRAADKTKQVVEEGELFATLNDAVDN